MRYSDKQKEKIFEQIFERIVEGDSLRKALTPDGMPTRDTFYGWIDSDKEKADQYARAIEGRADHYFEKILEIAEDTDNKNFQPNRVKLDAIKWATSKLSPKKYGDRQHVEHSQSTEQPLFPKE